MGDGGGGAESTLAASESAAVWEPGSTQAPSTTLTGTATHPGRFPSAGVERKPEAHRAACSSRPGEAHRQVAPQGAVLSPPPPSESRQQQVIFGAIIRSRHRSKHFTYIGAFHTAHVRLGSA